MTDIKETIKEKGTNHKITLTKEEVLKDYKLCYQSRQVSLLGRKEVFMGRAMFGIFGDGKEVPQAAMAKAFKKGDFRAGYYRDQTFMFATGMSNLREFFSQLYSHTDLNFDNHSAGRQMNCHYATRLLNEDGSWKNLMELYNSSADMAPTASQMPRLVGLAYASKLYRNNPGLNDFKQFSNNGNEVAFGTIGDASTSEGLFFESINAAGVLQIPMVVSVWDDGYGISVPKKYQTTKESISAILHGFQRDENGKGYEIYEVNGWDYPALCDAYIKGVQIAREKHIPAIYHITELTQPQGHSTSGSHERYKSGERLKWEKEHDCIVKMRKWMLDSGFISDTELTKKEDDWKEEVNSYKNEALKSYLDLIKGEILQLKTIVDELIENSKYSSPLSQIMKDLVFQKEPLRRDIMVAINKILRIIVKENTEPKKKLILWKEKINNFYREQYNSHLYSQSVESPLKIKEIKPVYNEESPEVNGAEVLNACFDAALSRDPRVFAIGEDVGKIGDVDQGFAGLQNKYGELRVTDTGIREATILGEGIGAALRGLRPIIEIQYLDYLLYALQTMSDDLASLHFRTKGGQKAPLIVRTRGHRLVGIWHSGSPMGMIINSLRGMHILVPRNMTQAAGFYNTLLKSDDPALIIEVLNAYRLKEKLPANIGEFTIPLGVPEVLNTGTDVTIVTYAVCCRIAMEAIQQLKEFGISVELIDVQTLLPFDINHKILESIKKTNRVIFLDEDVPGGATAFMLQKVLEEQNGYKYLDSPPVTITAKAHRPPYGRDGDYFTKPNVEQVFETVYKMMREVEPRKYKEF